MSARPTIAADDLTAWAQARALPRWLLPLAAVMSALLVGGALTVALRVANLSVRAVPDASDAGAAPAHALPSPVRVLAAAWAIVRLVDEWRSDDLANRFAAAAPFIAPRIRLDLKEHFQALLSGGVPDLRPAKAIVALAARVIARGQDEVTVALAYVAIDLVESEQGRLTIAHDEVAVMELTLSADALTDENPYGLLASAIVRHRGEEYPEHFWAGAPAHRVLP